MSINNLEIFKNEEFGEIRTVEQNGQIFFVANDVAKILGYKNPSDATNKHCRNAIMAWGSDSLGRRQEFKMIPESDLYRLIISSKLPSAEKFEKWVFEEVLPTIRKHGAYATAETIESIIANPDNGIKLLQALKAEQDKNKALEVENTELKPKALFADAVAGSNTSILIRELAKIIKGKGVNIGEHKLFGWLREHGYLIRKYGCDYNTPTQKSMELGVMELKKTAVNKPDGTVITRTTPLITDKGQVYFVNKFCGKRE